MCGTKSPEFILNCLPFLGHKKWEAVQRWLGVRYIPDGNGPIIVKL